MKNFEEKLKELTSDVEELWGRAYRDSLTSLLNRAALEDVVLKQLKHLEHSSQYSFALLFLDLNGFKNINDSYGHEIGDKLLVAVSERLKELHEDFAFRLGGDEFIVILTSCQSSKEALAQAKIVQDSLSATYDIDGNACTVAASIGVVFANSRSEYSEDDALAIREVIQNGDAAMYRAKMLSKTSLLMPDLSGSRQLQGRTYLFQNVSPIEFKGPAFKPVLRNGIGAGRLSVDGVVDECNFKFTQFADGVIMLSLTKSDANRSKVWGHLGFGNSKDLRFEGIIDTPWNDSQCLIKFSRLQQAGTSFQLTDENCEHNALMFATHASLSFTTGLISSIRFYIANLRLPVNDADPVGAAQMKLGNFFVRFGIFGEPDGYEELIHGLISTGGTDVTAWAELEIESEGAVESAVEMMDKVCRLLSFLQASQTSWVSYDLFSSHGKIIGSECRNSVVSKMVSGDDSGLWTISYLERTIPIMFVNTNEAFAHWNLTKIMAFLSTAQGGKKYLETYAHDLIYCIELLINVFLENKGESVERRSGLWSRERFSEELVQLCKAINLECLKVDDRPTDELFMQVTDEISILREHLHRNGSLNCDETSDDDEIMDRLGFERWRRTNFVRDFVRSCIKKILDPEGNYVVCSHQIGEEKYNGVLTNQ